MLFQTKKSAKLDKDFQHPEFQMFLYIDVCRAD